MHGGRYDRAGQEQKEMEGYPVSGAVMWHLLTYGLSVLTAFFISERRWRRRHSLLRAEFRADRDRDELRAAAKPLIDLIDDTITGLEKRPANPSGYLMGRRHALYNAVERLPHTIPDEARHAVSAALDALYEHDCRHDLDQARQKAGELRDRVLSVLD
jgi:hypothetical protein